MFKDWAGCGVYGRFRLGGKAAVAAGLLQVPLSLQPPHCVAAAGSAALRIPNADGAIILEMLPPKILLFNQFCDPASLLYIFLLYQILY